MTSSASSSSSPWLLAEMPLPARLLLLDALEPRDVVVLLSCCRALRNDHETASLALRGYNISRHFGRGCTLDWHLPVPAFFLSDAPEQEPCDLDHAGEPQLPWECHGDAGVKLLSLTGAMGFALNDVLYNSFVVDSTIYTVLPFVWPTVVNSPQPDAELEAASELATDVSNLQLEPHEKETETVVPEHGTSHRVTPLALHFENILTGMRNPKLTPNPCVTCSFCLTVLDEVDTYGLKGFAYLLHRDASVRAAGEQLRADGCDEDSDEWAATLAYYERLDALYDQEVMDEEDAPEIVRRLLECGEFPMMRGLEAFARDSDDSSRDESELVAVADAAGDAAHADFTNDTCKKLCVPLRLFFEACGFRDIRHEIVESSVFESIEKFSGVAPCGFVAGVMIASVRTAN